MTTQNAQVQNIKSAWMALVKTLKAAQVDSPVADARLLVQHALNISHEDLLMQSDRVLTADEQAAIDALALRRMAREPISRIIGVRAFWKADFIVTPATLDPRADSETLIEAALAHVQPGKGDAALRVLDLGTGTGCLLVSLLQEWPNAHGVGLDISADAAEVAKRNAEAIGVSSRAKIYAQGWEDYTTDALFDVVISNPPYIDHSEAKDLAPEVMNHDPHVALFAGGGGLDAYRSILANLDRWLKPSGWLILEIGYRQAEQVAELVRAAGLNVVETRTDLGGNPRAVIAQKPQLTAIH